MRVSCVGQWTAPLFALGMGLTACDPESSVSGTPGETDDSTVSSCDLPLDELVFGGVGRDGIVALSNPSTVNAEHPAADYLLPTDRVIGIELDGEWIAIPLNVLWYHEVVNLDRGGHAVAVTYCPLTGSSLAFDRSAVEGVEFGVSGLLFNNNLILFDRTEPASLWPQMSRRARCGPRLREPLPMVPVVEMEWLGWKTLHPDTQVLERPSQFSFRYTVNPLGPYEEDHDLIFFPMDNLDNRLPSKQRVLGVPQGGDGGTAYPFSRLGADQRRALHQRTSAGRVVVLWDGAVQGAAAYLATAAGQDLTFEAQGDTFVDLETGSAWGLDGVSVSGPLAGTRLDPFAEAFVSFWFAWAAFQPETVIWTP